jgi:hypothetical protein
MEINKNGHGSKSIDVQYNNDEMKSTIGMCAFLVIVI